jgi:hypothetical protein
MTSIPKMADVDPFDHSFDSKDERRNRKKKNANKMVVDGAGLKSVTIVVKSKKRGKK